jgi:hypothetical protein
MIILTETQKDNLCKVYGNYYLGAVKLTDGKYGVNEWEATAPPLPEDIKDVLQTMPCRNVLDIEIVTPKN